MKPHPLTRLFIWLTIAALACNAPFLAQQGGGGGFTTVAEPQALISPASYADTAQSLAAAIAELNRVQEQTLEHLRGTPTPDTVDSDLTQQAAAAMTVAQLAEQLAASTASQAGGSQEAAAAAQPYVAAAQVGYLTVIQTQNLRDDYKSGRVSSQEASNMIGEMGGMMWSGDHFDVGNNPAPFSDVRTNPASSPAPAALAPDAAGSVSHQVDQTSGKTTELAAWSSSSSETTTISVVIPAPRAPVSASQDPAQLAQMRTPDGQADGDIVRVAAAAKLVSLGATRGPRPSTSLAALGYWAAGEVVIQITVPAALVFQSHFDRALPYFETGNSGATSSANTGGPLVTKVDVTGGQPQIETPIEVTTDKAPVSLEVTKVEPTGNQSADTRDVNMTVKWTSSLAKSSFVIVCVTGSGSSATAPASDASGEATLLLAFSKLSDTALCQAKTLDQATTLGESQVIGLEGEAPPPAPAGNTYNGTFNLTQGDNGCNFSAAPATGGTLQLVVDFNAGTASGSFSGTGSGVRTNLDCSGNIADLNWMQNYTGTFSGTVDGNGNLNLTGTFSGTGSGQWSNCHTTNNQPFDCPANTSGPYA